MNRSNTSLWVSVMVAALALIVAARPALAQNNATTGTLTGTVTDQQGGVLPGVAIVATHEPTGTKYESVTGGDGRFQIPNVRVGGPYTVTASLSSFTDKTESNVNVKLGEERVVDLKLALATVAENVTVTATVPLIDTSRAGTGGNIPSQAIESLPSIQRSITDFARTSPYFNTGNLNGGDSFLSVAGRNNRYNNMQIDGAINNDLFGLSASGTPGGQTGTQPISLDALQEIQLVVSSYDVRQGNFSGGGINAVTKSGTNEISGTAYFFARNQGLIGQIPGVATLANPSPADQKVGVFTDRQGGFSVGGPIVKNKAFFFGNFDLARKNTPSGFSIDGSSGQLWNSGDQALVQQALNIMKTKYGFDPGGIGEFSKPTNSDKIFIRADFNLTPHNQLTVRTNYVNGLSDIGFPSPTIFLMPDGYYSIQDKVSSTVGQLNTTFSSSAFNELRVTYQRERNVRGDQPGFAAFPYTRIDFPDGNNIRLGTENSSTANKLNQDIVEISDDLTWLKGKHTFSFGTHNELFHFYNLFIQNLFGNYEFAAGPASDPLANLSVGIAQAYSHNFATDPSNPLLPAEFSVHQFGVYAGDQWRMAPNFTLTYGVRFDVPQFPDTPHANPLAVTDFGYRTDIAPAPKMFSPRAGFNWDLTNGGMQRSQLRGGGGLFSGRTPYVWLSDQYGNTGVDFTNLSVTFNATTVKIPFIADPNNQPTSVTGGATGRQTINLIDPNYKSPQVIRGNLAYDRDLGFWGLVATGEVLFSKNVNEIAYSNLNYIPGGTLPDGRLTFKKFDPNLNDAILLSNTSQGNSWTTSIKIDRPFTRGFFLSGSYSFNRSKSVQDGNSSVAASNWAGTPIGIDVNNPGLTTSQYQGGNRVSLSATVPIPLWKGLTSTASFFYNGQTGQPYVTLFNADVNLDGRATNDILFVPSSADQVNVINGTFDQLMAYINGDCSLAPFKGSIAPRNECTSPWTNQLDFRYAVNVPTGAKTKVELTMDVLNLLNLFNNRWGWQFYPNFNSPTLIGYTAPSAATGNKETFNLSTITSTSFLGTFVRDDLRSRWQAQWGLRIRF